MTGTWSDWQIAQLDECLMHGIGPIETAALIGKTPDEVCTKMGELGILFPSDESPSTAPDAVEPFPQGGGLMEKEALILRARAELAKLDAQYAHSDDERRVWAERARAYEAQARQLEESLARL